MSVGRMYWSHSGESIDNPTWLSLVLITVDIGTQTIRVIRKVDDTTWWLWLFLVKTIFFSGSNE